MDKRSAIDLLERGQGWIRLSSVENILRRETSCIDPASVAPLMRALYGSAETDFPPELQAEIEDNAADNFEPGCSDPAGPDCHDDSCNHHYGDIGSLDDDEGED